MSPFAKRFFESLQDSVRRLFNRRSRPRVRRRPAESVGWLNVAAEVLELRQMFSGAAPAVATHSATATASTSTTTYFLDAQGNLDRVSGNVTTQVAAGVQSFGASSNGQTVYWLTDSGSLNKTVFKSLTSTGTTTSVDVGVQSFALANNAEGIVDLTLAGALREEVRDQCTRQTESNRSLSTKPAIRSIG